MNGNSPEIARVMLQTNDLIKPSIIFFFIQSQFFISSESCLSQLGNKWRRRNKTRKLNSCYRYSFVAAIAALEFTGIPLKVSMIEHHYSDGCCHYSLLNYNIEIREIKRISIIKIKWKAQPANTESNRTSEKTATTLKTNLHPRMTKCNSIRTNVKSQLHDCMNHLTGTKFFAERKKKMAIPLNK